MDVKKTEEQIDITIKETDMKEVKELKFILNLGQNASTTYLTPLINGELNSIIIDSNGTINLNISLENYEDIILYENQGFYGCKCLNLIADATYFDGEKAQNFGRPILLNDKLRINVEGGFNSIIQFTIRYK